jgi:2,3-diketo-5-methylthio-1-phosphopentane phosphatase
MSERLRIFVGFEGTLTSVDMTRRMVEEFGDERLLAQFEVWKRDCCSVPGGGTVEVAKPLLRSLCDSISTANLDHFVDCQSVDPTFNDFACFCADRSIDVSVLSDGFDYVAGRILRNHGLGTLRVFANALTFEENGNGSNRAVVSFPHDDEDCRACTLCKRNVVVSQSAEDELIVYIGSSYSDCCVVRYADVVFARNRLQTFCQQENITHHVFVTFADVRHKIEQLRSRKRLQKRREAEANRQTLFRAG